jgi:hypothetical protein
MASSNIEVELQGKGLAILRPSDHVATGGEGSIYRIGDSVVKLYLDPAKMRQRGTPDKINLLTQFKHPYIVAPSGLATAKKEVVGFYMPFVENGHPMARVFTNEFWQKQGFDSQNAITLTAKMRDVVAYAHDHNPKALLVDHNELNWFVLLNGTVEPRIVDVDSWSLGKWTPTVIMPSIRDHHSKNFNEFTDWFSWGIVTFQIYTGIHPYKGTLDGFNKFDFEARMKANASVFSKGIRLNAAVRNFSTIPKNLLDWYEATFQNQERTKPPSPLDGTATPKAALKQRTVLTGTGKLVFTKLLDITESVIRTFPCGVVLTQTKNLYDLRSKKNIGKCKSKDCEVIQVEDGWLIADWDKKVPEYKYIDDRYYKEQPLSLNLATSRYFRAQNRLFVVMDQGISELKIQMFGKPILAAGKLWNLMINSTSWFEGIAIQDIMGAKFITLPFGNDAVLSERIKEIDSVKIINAKACGRFVALIGLDKTGNYRKIELTFSSDFTKYTIWEGQADGPELNMAILPKGVSCSIPQDGELNIFVPTSGVLSKIPDKYLDSAMVLSNWGDVVIYIDNGSIWSVKMS